MQLSLSHTRLAKAASIFIFTLGICAAIAPVSTDAADAPAPTSTGAKIGTAIKDAIDIALPSVGSVLDLIFGKTAKPTATTTKQQATDALTKPTSDTIKQVKTQLQPVIDEADELSVLNEFSVPTSLAQVELAAIRGGLEAKTPDWDNAKLHWTALSNLLSDISAIQQTEIDQKVHTDSTKVLLMDAKEAAKQSAVYLSAAIQSGAAAKSPDASKALTRVTEIEKSFHDVVKLVTVVSVDMKIALGVVANYAKVNAGSVTPTLKQEQLETSLRRDIDNRAQAIRNK